MTFANQSTSLRSQGRYTDYPAVRAIYCQRDGGRSCQQESESDNQQQSAIMQAGRSQSTARRVGGANGGMSDTLENDSSILDLFSTSFLEQHCSNSQSRHGGVGIFHCYHHDRHHQRTDGPPHTPFPVRLHVHMQVIPKRGRCEFRPTFGGLYRNAGGVTINKREDGASVDSNEVARHAHGKQFTGARPESEPVASNTVE